MPRDSFVAWFDFVHHKPLLAMTHMGNPCRDLP